MRAYKRKGDRVYTLKFRVQGGAWVERSTGTRDAHTARAIERMVDDLGQSEKRAWDVLERVVSGTVSLAGLLDLWRASREDVVTVRALLHDVDVSPLVSQWAASLARPSRGVSKDTAQRYPSVVRQYIPADAVVLRSSLTSLTVSGWVLDTDAKAGTVRRRAAALSSFFTWLTDRGVLMANPMDGVKLPAPGKARDMWWNTAQVLQFAEMCSEPLRTLEVFLAATAADLSTACTLLRSDVDLDAMTVRLRGTKTHTRDRSQPIASFAQPFVRDWCRPMLPAARVFPMSRWDASDWHRDAINIASEVMSWAVGYQLRDHRHTWAVRMAKAGAPMRLIADGLGHANEALAAKVYARYLPTAIERTEWERKASARDAVEVVG